MVENSENRPEGEQLGSGSEETEEVIELSDIAVGTTQEDEEIIELTEEVVDEAMGAVSRTTGDADEGEVLDLSEAEKMGLGDALTSPASGGAEGETDSVEERVAAVEETNEVEEHISHELDDYFGSEETFGVEASSAKAEIDAASTVVESDQPVDTAMPSEELESKIERVIEEKLSERIEKIFSDIIEARLKESMEQLKKDLLETTDK